MNIVKCAGLFLLICSGIAIYESIWLLAIPLLVFGLFVIAIGGLSE